MKHVLNKNKSFWDLGVTPIRSLISTKQNLFPVKFEHLFNFSRKQNLVSKENMSISSSKMRLNNKT